MFKKTFTIFDIYVILVYSSRLLMFVVYELQYYNIIVCSKHYRLIPRAKTNIGGISDAIGG